MLRGDLSSAAAAIRRSARADKRDAAVFDEWAAALKAAGITRDRGPDHRRRPGVRRRGVGPGWSWDYLEAGYAAPVGRAPVQREHRRPAIAPAAWPRATPAIVQLAPGAAWRILNRFGRSSQRARRRAARSTSCGASTGRSSRSRADPGRRAGTDPDVAVVNPTLYFAQCLKDALIARGIPVTARPSTVDDVAAELAAGPPSPRAGCSSDRVAAAARDRDGADEGQPEPVRGDAAEGGRGASRRARYDRRRAGGRRPRPSRAWGIPHGGYVLADGSGLSRYDYVAPATITTLLGACTATRGIATPSSPRCRSPARTARSRRGCAAPAPKGNAVAKTGSIANVRSLSGYVKTRNGETLAFSILANDFVDPVRDRELDRRPGRRNPREFQPLTGGPCTMSL